jgi:hypothetical protein
MSDPPPCPPPFAELKPDLDFSAAEQSGPTCAIQRMPPEILLEIFKHLCVVDVSQKRGIWDSLKPPDFLEGVLTVSSFSPSRPHWEHPALRVCRQWRALLRTTLFASRIVVGSDVGDVPLDRVANWLRNTGHTQLECRFSLYDKSKPWPKLLETANKVLGHISRITVLSIAGCYPMMQPILSGSEAYAAPNLVSLALCIPLGFAAVLYVKLTPHDAGNVLPCGKYVVYGLRSFF